MKAPNSNRRVAHLFGFCKGANKFSRHILFCSTGLNCAMPSRLERTTAQSSYGSYAYGEAGVVKINEWRPAIMQRRRMQRESISATFAQTAKVGHPPMNNSLTARSSLPPGEL